MSDWSTAWQAAREGLAQGAQMRMQREARQKQDQLEQDRLKLEQDRSAREEKEAAARLDLLNRRINRPSPVTPEGMEVKEMTYDEYGNPVPKFGAIVKPPAATSVGGQNVIYDPNSGRFELPKQFFPTSAPVPKTVTGPGGEKFTVWESTDPSTGQPKFSNPEKQGSNLSATGQEKLGVTLNAFDNLGTLANHVAKHGDSGGPVASKLGSPFAYVFGPSDARRDFGADVAKNLTPLAKGILGETGSLSNFDMERYLPLIPAFEDAKAARIAKVQDLRQLLVNSAKNQLDVMRANNIDTAPYEAQLQAKLATIPSVVNSTEEYNALPAGSLYMDSNGQIARKPASQ